MATPSALGDADIASLINQNTDGNFVDQVLTDWFGQRDNEDSEEDSDNNDSDDGKSLIGILVCCLH